MIMLRTVFLMLFIASTLCFSTTVLSSANNSAKTNKKSDSIASSQQTEAVVKNLVDQTNNYLSNPSAIKLKRPDRPDFLVDHWHKVPKKLQEEYVRQLKEKYNNIKTSLELYSRYQPLVTYREDLLERIWLLLDYIRTMPSKQNKNV